MKRMLLLALFLLLVCALTACGDPGADTPGEVEQEQEPEVEWIPTPSDIDTLPENIEKVGTDNLPENQQLVNNQEEITDKLGEAVVLPAEYEITRTTILDGDIVQVEFKVDGISYTGRYAQGLRDNMSGMTNNLVENKTEKIGDISVSLRYTTEEQAQPGFSSSLGVADAYDSAKNISFMVVQMRQVTQESLMEAMRVLMESLGRELPAEPEAAAETEAAS